MKLDDEPQQDPQIKKDFSRYPKLRLKDILLLTPLQRAIYTSNLMKENDMNEYINNLNKNILEITIKELSEIVQKTWATQELLIELRAKFKICQLFAKFSLFNYSQATKFCIVIDKLIILFMNSSKEDRGSLLKQEKKFKVLSPIVKSLLHIAINFNDQMIISHLKQERELEKVHFFHTKSAIGIQIAQNVLNIMTLIRELAPSFTMEDFQNQNEDKDIKQQQQQSSTQDNTNDKQNSKQKLIHNDLMKNQFLNYWENPKVNRVLRNITRNCFNILDLFFGVYECYSVPFTLLSMSPYSEVFFSIYCNILTQFELDFVLRIRDFTKQIEKNLHLVTNGFKTDELNNILEQVVNECKIKEIEYRHHIHNSSTCIEEDNKLLAQKEKLTELIPINCDNDKYLSFRKQRIAFDGKIDDVTKLKLLINKTYLIPIVFRIIKTFHTLSQNKGHNFSIERSLCQRIIKIAFFFISNNVDNSIYFLMSDITLSIELLNGEQLHGMLDLVQQALITIRYHSVEITINSNLMRLIKVATTKANSVKLIEKVLKIISTILKVNFNNEQNSLKKLRKIVIALYKNTETLNISCKTLLLQQQQQNMIETDERVYRLIKNFLRITNYLFEGSVFLDERKFLETILTKDEICTVLKQKHLEFSIRKEIITLYRITYIDVSVKKNNINYYISLLINDPPKSAVGIGYMKYLNFFYKLLTIKVSQRYLLNKKESKVKDTQVNNTNDTNNNNSNSNKDCTYKILKIELDQMKQLLFNNDLVIHNSKKKKYIEALLKAVFVYLSKMTGYIVHSGEDERKQFHRMLIGFLELKKFIYQHKDIFTEHIDDKKRKKNIFRNKLCSWGKDRKSFINYPQSPIEKDIEEITQEIIHLKKKNFDFSNFTTLNQIFQSHQYKFLNKPIFPNIKTFFEKRSTLFPNEQHDKKKTYLHNNNLLNTNFQMNLFNLITKYLNGKMALTHSYLIKMLNDDNKVFNVKNRVLLVKSSFFFMTNHNFVWSYRDICLWNIFRLLQFDTNETQKNCFELFNRRRKKLLDFNSLIDILTENLMSIILREMNPCITMIKHDYYRTVLIIKIMKYLCEEHNHDFQRIFFSKEYDGVAINYSSTPYDNANNNKDDNKNDSIDNVFGIANVNMERPVAVSKKNLFENKLFTGNNTTNNATPRKIKSLQYNNDTANWGKLRNKKPNPDTEIEDLHEVTLSEEYLLEIQKNSASVFEYMLSIVGKIMLLSRWIISKENEKFDQFLYDLYFVILEFLIETIQGTKQDYILSIINQNNESPDLFGNVLQDIKLLIFKENNSEIAFQVKKDSFDFLMAFLEECETPERLLFKISSVILPTEIPKKMVTTMCLLYNEQNETNSQNVKNDNESSYSNNSIHIEKNLHMFSPEMKKYFMNLYYNDLSLRNDIKFALTNKMFQYFKLYAVEERYLNSAAADFYNKLMSFRECKVNKIYNIKDENNTETLIDSCYYDQYLCLLFFESITGVVFVNSPSANMPTRVLFTINPNVSFISKLTKAEFLNTVDRSNRLSKLKGLMETCDEFFEEINFKVSSGKISKIKSYIIDMNFYWLEMVSCAITLVVNLIMLVKVGGVGETKHFISTKDALLNVLGFINFIFNVLVLVLWFYTKFIIYYNSECQKQLRKKEEISKRLSLFEIEDPEKPKLSIYEKAKIAFIVIVLKNKTTSFVWNGVMSGVGAFMNTHFLFVLQMLSAINLSEDIKAMLWFIFKKLTQLVLIFFFIAIFNLIFATIAFFNFSQDWIRFISAKEQITYPSSFSFLNDLIGSPYIEEQSYENYCGTLLYCFFTHLSYGMRYDGGIADNMKLASFTNNRSYYVPRFFYDELYFVFLVVLSLGMISSTIYTIGNDWINKVRFIKRDINEICFICGIDRAICEREGETFKEHKKKKHNIWKYVEYMIGLKYVDIQETNAINSYVIESLEKKVVGWVPVKNEGD